MFFRFLFLGFITFSLLPIYASDIVSSDAVQSSENAAVTEQPTPEVVDMDALARQSTPEVVDMDALAKQSTPEVVDMDALAKQSTPEVVDMDAPKDDSVAALFEASETAAPTVMSVQPVDTTGMTRHVIIAGTFQMQAKSDDQLALLTDTLNARPEIVALKQAYGFEYVSRSSGKYFVVAIEPVYGNEVLKKVLTATREVFSDAYEYVRTTKAVPAAVKPVEVETAKLEPTVVEAVVVEEDLQTPVNEERSMKSEPAVTLAAEEAEAKPEPTADDLDSARQVLKKAAARAVNKPSSTSEDTEMDDMLISGGISVVILLLIVIVMMRGKKKKVFREQSAEGKEDSVVKIVTSVAEEVTEVPAALVVEEPIPEVAEEVMDAPAALVVEEPTPEVAEEVSVEAEEEVLQEPVPEVIEEVREEAVAKVSTAVQRKKREPKPGRGKISKEDLAEFRGNRILMAEDNLINQKVINALLADSGMEIIIANDGQEAIDILASDSNFQMIFMDAHMPIKDGFETSREIRANAAYDHIPIVALSGDIGADDLKAMAEAGMEEQLAKPVHLEDLYDVMYCYFDIEEEAGEGEEDEFELLSETDELNVEVGLEISGGDEELYKEILQEFVEMYSKSDEMLNNFIVHDDESRAKALLLDIRGVAANIGASQLSDTAGALREAILEGKEAKYTLLYESYCGHLRKLLADIGKI